MATTTAAKIIRRALLLIDVADAAEALEAGEFADSLDVLNAMLAEWHEAGIGLQDYAITSLTDSLATDLADVEAIAYQLALRLAPEYGAVPSPAVVDMAHSLFARMRLRYFQPGVADFSELPCTRSTFNITVGY